MKNVRQVLDICAEAATLMQAKPRLDQIVQELATHPNFTDSNRLVIILRKQLEARGVDAASIEDFVQRYLAAKR